MKLARRLAFTSVFLELAGIILLALVVASSIAEDASASQPVISPSYAAQREYKSAPHGKPLSISVPALGIETSVQDGYYDSSSGRWTITEDAAFFATITDEINAESGSTFIYGHNSDKIFGKLRSIRSGAIAKVVTNSGYIFTYTFTGREDVAPSDTKKLEYSGKPRLVLQTCSGFFNQTRQLTYFTLTSYEKANKAN